MIVIPIILLIAFLDFLDRRIMPCQLSLFYFPYSDADVVFEGIAGQAIEHISDRRKYDGKAWKFNSVPFKITKWWKGPPEENLSIIPIVEQDGDIYQYVFYKLSPQKTYLVYGKTLSESDQKSFHAGDAHFYKGSQCPHTSFIEIKPDESATSSTMRQINLTINDIIF